MKFNRGIFSLGLVAVLLVLLFPRWTSGKHSFFTNLLYGKVDWSFMVLTLGIIAVSAVLAMIIWPGFVVFWRWMTSYSPPRH